MKITKRDKKRLKGYVKIFKAWEKNPLLKTLQNIDTTPIVFISGPYRSDKGIYGVAENIERAKKVAMKFWKRGSAVICPHMNSAFLDGIVPDERFLHADLEILRRCDIIVMMMGWQHSKGSVAELKEVQRLNGINEKQISIIFDTGGEM